MNVDECLRGYESSTYLQYALFLCWVHKEDVIEIMLSDGHGVEASRQQY